jgi:hypothetical protein
MRGCELCLRLGKYEMIFTFFFFQLLFLLCFCLCIFLPLLVDTNRKNKATKKVVVEVEGAKSQLKEKRRRD